MKCYYLFLITLCCFPAHSQRLGSTVKITYQRLANGKLSDQDKIIVYADKDRNWITSETIINGTSKFPYEQQCVEPHTGNYFQVAALSKKDFAITTDSTSIGKQQFEITDKTKKILGYQCQMAKTIINSNTIEVWYASAGINAGPSVLGQKLGLVLEVVRNGNYVTQAVKIDKIKKIPESLNADHPAKPVDMLSYRDLVWKSRFIEVTLFKNAQVNFDPEMKSASDIL